MIKNFLEKIIDIKTNVMYDLKQYNNVLNLRVRRVGMAMCFQRAAGGVSAVITAILNGLMRVGRKAAGLLSNA